MAELGGHSWGQAKRFEFLEWRIFWVGKLNRKDLEQQFGISTPQASIDIKNYQEMAPDNIGYDATVKAYIVGDNFSPRFLKISGERYLMQLRAIQMGAIELKDTWFEKPPTFDVMPQPLRRASDQDLKTIVHAVSQSRCLSVKYRSFGGQKTRTIAPHALAYDGSRWHARAWCFENREYRDFSLSRMDDLALLDIEPISAEADVAWNTTGTLVLAPHPDLNDQNRKTVEIDYEMQDGVALLTMRLSLVYYFIKKNNLDVVSLDANRTQVVLTNKAEIDLELATAKSESRRLSSLRMGT